MKSAVLPQIRVEPALRTDLEAALQEGETLSSFVESAVRSAVAFRQVQTRFHEDGELAWQNYLSSGEAVAADEVLGRMQARLAQRRRQLQR